MNQREIPPIHPGEILFEEFLKPMEMTQYQLRSFMAGEVFRPTVLQPD
jgi:plasmid maintenance system antidote protein VapI